MLVGFAEGLGAAKTLPVKAGYDVDSNRELIGLGASDLGSGLASAMVVNGSLSKTVNGGNADYVRERVRFLVGSAVTAVVIDGETLSIARCLGRRPVGGLREVAPVSGCAGQWPSHPHRGRLQHLLTPMVGF